MLRGRGADREAKEKAHRRNGRTSRKMTPKAAQGYRQESVSVLGV